MDEKGERAFKWIVIVTSIFTILYFGGHVAAGFLR